MPPRPFPFPFRVGNDICRMQRIHDSITTEKKSRSFKDPTHQHSRLNLFVKKLLTWPEQDYFYSKYPTLRPGVPLPKPLTDLATVSQFLAGRWAAKEAVRKACKHLGESNGFHSIIILPLKRPFKSRRPQALLLRDRLPELPEDTNLSRTFDIESLDGQLCEVSISHDTKYATAVAIVPVVGQWESQAVESEGKDDDDHIQRDPRDMEEQ